jgi:hypothetical protein
MRAARQRRRLSPPVTYVMCGFVGHPAAFVAVAVAVAVAPTAADISSSLARLTQYIQAKGYPLQADRL